MTLADSFMCIYKGQPGGLDLAMTPRRHGDQRYAGLRLVFGGGGDAGVATVTGV